MTIQTAWARRRREVLTRDRRRCTSCGLAAPLEVHHQRGSLRRDLKRGELTAADQLTSLCRGCHRLAHGGAVSDSDPEVARWRARLEALS